jgi:hypothetical protein
MLVANVALMIENNRLVPTGRGYQFPKNNQKR